MIIQLDKAIQKKEELEFYNSKLEELNLKQAFIQQEIKLTQDIIKLIRNECTQIR